MRFFEELKRRNVFRVGLAYVLMGWVLLQGADFVLDLIGAPDWVIRVFALAAVIGLPVALFFAWAFELTPEGIKREADVDRSDSIRPHTRRKLDYAIFALLVIAVGYFVLNEVRERSAQPGQSITAQNDAVAAAAAAPAEPSIAVLPFADMSAAGDQEYFSDGISEELLNLLVRVEGLKVASRTSSFAFKDSPMSISDIAQELKVGHVLEGSVRKSQNRLRITAQLIDAASDRHLWSETFDRELDDIFVIQDEIASAIVSALQQELGLQTSSVIEVKADTANLDAYELYLKARGLFLARDNLRLSIELFEQAVALDPDFARAWEGLAAVYSVAPSWGIQDRPYEDLVVPTADRALALNPGLSMPYAVKADYAWREQGAPMEAEALFNQAIENDASNATAHLWRGIFYSALGKFAAAEADFQQCLEIDPQYGNCTQHYALHLVITGQARRGLQMLDEVVVAGFFGNANLFTPTRIREGQLAAAAMTLWLDLRNRQDLNINRNFPMEPLINAVLYPERDHSAGLAQVQQWLAANGLEQEPPVFLMSVLGEHQYMADTGIGWPLGMLWLPEHRSFRESPYFKPAIQRHGFLSYWQANGFPPMCRPVGDEDFQCD